MCELNYDSDVMKSDAERKSDNENETTDLKNNIIYMKQQEKRKK